MVLDDLRKTLEATLGLLTPAKAQQLAKDMMEPGTAKEQIAKTAADLMDWSQSNRERLRLVHPSRDLRPDEERGRGHQRGARLREEACARSRA